MESHFIADPHPPAGKSFLLGQDSELSTSRALRDAPHDHTEVSAAARGMEQLSCLHGRTSHLPPHQRSRLPGIEESVTEALDAVGMREGGLGLGPQANGRG